MGIGTTIGVIGATAASSLGGAAISASGQRAAGQTVLTAAQQAQAAAKAGEGTAIGALQGNYGQAIGGYAPYTQAGAAATANLSQMLAPGGQLARGWTGTFQAPTLEQAMQTPGYQFTQQQGMQAIQNAAAAKGTLMNAGTLKQLAGYTTGLANQTYNDVFNRQMQSYGTNYNTFMANQQNLYNRMYGQQQMGLQATGNVGQLYAGLGSNVANTTMQGTQLQNQALMQGAYGRAQGQAGAANAWAAGLTGVGSDIMQGVAAYEGAKPPAAPPNPWTQQWGDISPTQVSQQQIAGVGGVPTDVPNITGTFAPGSASASMAYLPPANSGIYSGMPSMPNAATAPLSSMSSYSPMQNYTTQAYNPYNYFMYGNTGGT